MPRTAVRTYLFADLRDYTAFVEARGDAAATRLIRGFRQIVREAIGQHRGAEIHTEGDSFYVVFETPGNARDHVEATRARVPQAAWKRGPRTSRAYA